MIQLQTTDRERWDGTESIDIVYLYSGYQEKEFHASWQSVILWLIRVLLSVANEHEARKHSCINRMLTKCKYFCGGSYCNYPNLHCDSWAHKSW